MLNHTLSAVVVAKGRHRRMGLDMNGAAASDPGRHTARQAMSRALWKSSVESRQLNENTDTHVASVHYVAPPASPTIWCTMKRPASLSNLTEETRRPVNALNRCPIEPMPSTEIGTRPMSRVGSSQSLRSGGVFSVTQASRAGMPSGSQGFMPFGGFPSHCLRSGAI